MTPCLRSALAASLAVASAEGCGEAATPGAGAGGGATASASQASSSGAVTSNSATGAGLAGGGGSDCPEALTAATGECFVPSSVICEYPSDCDDHGCAARCLGSEWTVLCEACGTPPACPATAPANGSACAADTSETPCAFDACAAENDFAVATCLSGQWSVSHVLCDPAGCMSSAVDVPVLCLASAACVSADACLLVARNCPPNPCTDQIFSCACASVLCGPGTHCVDAKAGTAVCAANDVGLEVIATEQWDPSSLVLDGSDVFWTAIDTKGPKFGAIRRAPKTGGGATTIRYMENSGFIAAEAGLLYSADSVAGDVTSFDASGNQLVSIAQQQSAVGPIAVVSPYVYWTAAFGNARELRKAPETGGPAMLLTPASFAVGKIVVRDGYVFWANASPIELRSIPAAGGPSSLLLAGAFADYGVAAGWIYLTVGNDVVRLPETGGVLETLANIGEPLGSIGVDTDYLYVATLTGNILRLPIDGGTPELLAEGQLKVRDFAIDATHLYWANELIEPCGSINRILK